MIFYQQQRGFKDQLAVLGDDINDEVSAKAGDVDFWKAKKETESNALVLKTRDEVEDYVLSLTRGYFLTVQKKALTLESTFFDHGLDSLDVIELIIQIEDELGILIDAENLEKFKKPKHFVNFILSIEAYKREFHKLPTDGTHPVFDWQVSFPGVPWGKKKK